MHHSAIRTPRVHHAVESVDAPARDPPAPLRVSNEPQCTDAPIGTAPARQPGGGQPPADLRAVAALRPRTLPAPPLAAWPVRHGRGAGETHQRLTTCDP